MKDLIIIGASGFGREVLQWVKDINKVEKTWNVLGFLDDNLNALDEYECDYKVIGTIKEWVPQDNENFVIAIANPQIKEVVTNSIEKRGGRFVSIVHPTAIISDYTQIGKGLVAYPYAKINVNCKVGDYVTLLGSSLGHDVAVGDYSTITGMCAINGHAVIGRHVFVGSHSVIAPSKKVGDGAYVGNGSVVIANVRSGYKVFGNPARKMNV